MPSDQATEKFYLLLKFGAVVERVPVENIAYRMSACWYMRILVPSRSLQGDGNLYHK